MLKLYNSLSREVEEFVPIDPSVVRMYTCGPTVYQFAHIGNFRAYSTADLLVRVLRQNGFVVNFVMNITDVGHLTSDADTGEDKLEKSAKREGKTAWEVAEFYTEAFLRDFEALHLTSPDTLAKATAHIKEQIALIERLEKKGFTYQTTDGIYFDTARFKNYGELSNMDRIKEGARVDINAEKKNPRDFALWKFSDSEARGPVASSSRPTASFSVQALGGTPSGRATPFRITSDVIKKRQMEWDSPWGVGFPGWHVECSAMSMKYLGEQLDIHTGGVDHKEIHHPNEIAQSEGATGKQFVKYWVYTAFMMVAGQKMSKSLGNIYTLYDLGKQGYDPLALRYLYLQTHYRQEMNFTFPALDAAGNALKKLRMEVARWGIQNPESRIQNLGEEYERRFWEAVEDDLNMAKALGVLWELVKSDIPGALKAENVFRMDEVLGLDLRNGSAEVATEKQIVPAEVKALLKERERLRSERRFNQADNIRKKIGDLGYEIEDGEKGTRVRRK